MNSTVQARYAPSSVSVRYIHRSAEATGAKTQKLTTAKPIAPVAIELAREGTVRESVIGDILRRLGRVCGGILAERTGSDFLTEQFLFAFEIRLSKDTYRCTQFTFQSAFVLSPLRRG